MNLPKAISLIDDYLHGMLYADRDELETAIRLGASAMRAIIKAREEQPHFYNHSLPGEDMLEILESD